jgi:ubiquitin-like-conjugating enzyme ATG3
MQMEQKMYEMYKGTVERVTGPRTVSAFLEKGVLSVPEFILAGDNLVSKCPTWSWCAPSPPWSKDPFFIFYFWVGWGWCLIDLIVWWVLVVFCREAGDPSKRKSYFPADKQFLVTRNGMLLPNRIASSRYVSCFPV